jgi:glycosyltransferase involved in cell wall biosynthesis
MVRWDRYCNYLATDIVSISNIVTQTLVKSEHVPEAKITRIPHGFDLESFSAGNLETKELLEKKYNPGKKHPVVGVISRFIEWKGIQYIIPAFQDVLKKHPNALLLLFNASGNYKSTIQSLLKVLPKDSFLEVEFEPEVTSLYSLFDVFVHTPIDDHSEAFGQVYVEALAAGIPSVFTLSGIAHEFVIDNKNALVVPHKDSPAILNSLIRLLENPTFASALAKQGSQDVRQLFGLDKMINALENLYTSE